MATEGHAQAGHLSVSRPVNSTALVDGHWFTVYHWEASSSWSCAYQNYAKLEATENC